MTVLFSQDWQNFYIWMCSPTIQGVSGRWFCFAVERLVENLQVQVQGYLLKFPVYLLPIEGVKIILNVNWLATLGSHIMDYKALSIQFYSDGKFITIYSDRHFGPQPASIYQLPRLCRSKNIAPCYFLAAKDVNLGSIVLSSSIASSPNSTTNWNFLLRCLKL